MTQNDQTATIHTCSKQLGTTYFNTQMTYMQKQVLTQQQRHAIFQNNKHIQGLADRMLATTNAYDANPTQGNLLALKTAQNIYNLNVKELNDRLDAGYTY